MSRVIGVVAVLLIAGMLGIAGSAAAQTPPVDQYGNPQPTPTQGTGTVTQSPTPSGGGVADDGGAGGGQGTDDDGDVGEQGTDDDGDEDGPGGAGGSGGGKNPGGDGIGGEGSGGGADTENVEAGGNALPFTGWDVGLVALLGLALLAAGFLLRAAQRLTPRRQ